MFKHGESGGREGNIEHLGPFVDYEFSKAIHCCAVKGWLSTYLHNCTKMAPLLQGRNFKTGKHLHVQTASQ